MNAGNFKINLDKIAADHSREMLEASDKETLERLVTKALGVLQSQGVYALMLFLFSRKSDEGKIAPFMRKALYNVLLSLPHFKDDEELKDFTGNSTAEDVLKWYSDKIVEDLDTLLLVRDLYEQTLIYARFHAKAAE